MESFESQIPRVGSTLIVYGSQSDTDCNARTYYITEGMQVMVVMVSSSMKVLKTGIIRAKAAFSLLMLLTDTRDSNSRAVLSS